jgi:hypothetical protein
MKCLSKDRNCNGCRNTHLCESRFCKNHQYMNDYTNTMLETLQLCRGCKKMYWFEGDIKTCDTCRDRGKATRSEASISVIPCGKEGCSNKRSTENAYCGLHQVCLFVDETSALGKKLCRNYVRGCRAQLDAEYECVRCLACLEKDRERDKAKRSVVSTEIVDGRKQCSVCCGFKPLEDYIGINNQETKTCSHCRDDFRKQNEKRDKEHVRELDRKNSKKPERVAVKNEWNKANPEKVALKEVNKRNRNYEGCVNLTKEQFDTITKQPCYYCGIMQEKGFNGIDRMDSIKGYEIENCVSCCTECNMMKGAVDNITFVRRVEHILTHNSLLTNGKRYPDAFSNQSGSYYSRYKTNAEQRKYVFELSEEQYYKLIKEECYICGKKTNENHTNGVDRFDNEQGYTFNNSNSCCGQCNIMKKEMDYSIFMKKLQKIYENCGKKEMKPPSICIVNMLNHNKNKLSSEKRKENSRLKLISTNISLEI